MTTDEEIKKSLFPTIKPVVNRIIGDKRNLTENPLFDIEALAKELGISDIQRVSPQIPYDDKIEYKTINIKYAVLIGTVIFINQNNNPEKQRFSIAHEIYHLLMRDESEFTKAVARQGEAWKKQYAGSKKAMTEVVADYFAANLLLPTEQFILWEDKSDEEIAGIFGVEKRCIEKRRSEIEFELDLMAPKNLSSDVTKEEQTPLSLNEIDQILEGHNINDNGRA